MSREKKLAVDSESQDSHAAPCIGILGGSFDPVHKAHTQLAIGVKHTLQLDKVNLLPCHIPPHKQSLYVPADVRVAMLRLAIEENPELQLDLRELQREGPSYTRDTVAEIRQEHGAHACLNFIVGWDSWQNLCSWYRWQELLNYVNLVVLKRPGFSLDALETELQAYYDEHQASPSQIKHFTHGKIVYLELEEYDIASTDIRERIRKQSPYSDLLDKKVAHYIAEHQLYR